MPANRSSTTAAKSGSAASKAAAKSSTESANKAATKAASKLEPKTISAAASKTGTKAAAVKPESSVPANKMAGKTAVPVPASRKSKGSATATSKTVDKDKPKKPKLVRDSFTMPEDEYAALGEVKKACLKAGIAIKKSELLRIGVALVRQMDVPRLKLALESLPQLKAGRPKKSK